MTDFFQTFLRWLSQWPQVYRLLIEQPVLVFSIELSLLAVLLSLVAIRKSGKVSRPRELEKAIHDLNIRLSEHIKVSQATSDAQVLALTREPTPEQKKESAVKEVAAEKPEAGPKAKPEIKPEIKTDEFIGPDGHDIKTGLSKTRTSFLSQLKRLFTGKNKLDDSSYEELEEILITGDLGVKTTELLINSLKEEIVKHNSVDEHIAKDILKRKIESILEGPGQNGPVTAGIDPTIKATDNNKKPYIILMVGVNGVGKTTTIAKLAYEFKQQGLKVLVGACDTFRAAAGEQLSVWANRVGADIEAGLENAKPTTVAYQAVHRARKENHDVLIIDTAGRLHTKVNLMNELANISKIIERESGKTIDEIILVVDASTGQNALIQAREFQQLVKLTGIIVTKLDGTAKGGIIVGIKHELGIPIRYVGVGESMHDLRVFSAQEFADGLFSNDL